MEQPIKVLAIGRNEEIMTVLHRLLNAKEQRTGITVTTDTAAIAACQQEVFDLVLFCAGVTLQEAAALSARIRALQPRAVIARHYGGGSGLLENEIQTALAQRQ